MLPEKPTQTDFDSGGCGIPRGIGDLCFEPLWSSYNSVDVYWDALKNN